MRKHRPIQLVFHGVVVDAWRRIFVSSFTPAVTRVGYTLGYIELPVLAELAITDRCNIRCRFCYASCQKETSDQMTEMSVKECKQILRVIRHDAGVPSVSFTGGEPMLRPEIFDLIEYAHKSLKMRVNLITNGTLISENTARKLRKSGLASARSAWNLPIRRSMTA